MHHELMNQQKRMLQQEMVTNLFPMSSMSKEERITEIVGALSMYIVNKLLHEPKNNNTDNDPFMSHLFPF